MTGMEWANDLYANAYKEEVKYQNPLLFFKIWEIYTETDQTERIESVQWHYHKEVEVLAIIEGYLGVQSKKSYQVLGPGDCIVLGSLQPHRTHKLKTDKLKYIVFQVDLVKHFDPSTMPYTHGFSELTEPLDRLNYIFSENVGAKRQLHQIITDIFNEAQTLQKGYEISISSLIKQIMLLLLRNDTNNVLNLTEDKEQDVNRLRPVLEYIDEHLAEKVTVEDACDRMNLSYHYFIKLFKKTMGLSFLDYINEKRIKKAERLLLTSDMSILEISYEVGISNMAQFYKLFKRHNQCSPKEYKERMRSGNF